MNPSSFHRARCPKTSPRSPPCMKPSPAGRRAVCGSNSIPPCAGRRAWREKKRRPQRRDHRQPEREVRRHRGHRQQRLRCRQKDQRPQAASPDRHPGRPVGDPCHARERAGPRRGQSPLLPVCAPVSEPAPDPATRGSWKPGCANRAPSLGTPEGWRWKSSNALMRPAASSCCRGAGCRFRSRYDRRRTRAIPASAISPAPRKFE